MVSVKDNNKDIFKNISKTEIDFDNINNKYYYNKLLIYIRILEQYDIIKIITENKNEDLTNIIDGLVKNKDWNILKYIIDKDDFVLISLSCIYIKNIINHLMIPYLNLIPKNLTYKIINSNYL